jgi:hypothetical protein
VGIQDYMKEVDRTDTVQIGVWKRSSGAIRSFGTQSMHGSNYQYDRNEEQYKKG